jgi:hypothetical protein
MFEINSPVFLKKTSVKFENLGCRFRLNSIINLLVERNAISLPEKNADNIRVVPITAK